MLRHTISPFTSRQVMAARDFEVFHYADSSPSNVVMHHHDFVEVYFLLDGVMHYVVEGRRYELHPGNLLVITPNLLHHPDIRGSATFERVVLWISLPYFAELARNMPWMMGFMFKGNTAFHRLVPSPDEADQLKNTISSLLREKAEDRFGAEQCCAALLTQLFIHIQRVATRQAGKAGAFAVAPAGDSLYEVFRYINDHLEEDLTLQGLAARFYTNVNTLSRRFKQHAGITVCEYIRKKRLAIARIKIGQGMDISAASAACGFPEYSTFYRSFTHEYGISPSAFRKAWGRDM